MNVPLPVVIALIFLILIAGCSSQSPSGKPVTPAQPSPSVSPVTVTRTPTSGTPVMVVTTISPTAPPASAFPGSGFTPLITVTGQSGKTSDTFSVPGGYWELMVYGRSSHIGRTEFGLLLRVELCGVSDAPDPGH